MNSSLLFPGFLEFLAVVPGSKDRDLLVIMARRAQVFCLGSEMVGGLSVAIDSVPHTVEQSLDYLVLPAGVVWLEWDYADRFVAGMLMEEGNTPDRVGVLLWGDEAGEQVQGIVCHRYESGKIDFSPAVLSWAGSDLARHARLARHSYGIGRDEALERMIRLVSAGVPESFRQEMEELNSLEDVPGDLDLMVGGAMRSTSAETIFIFAALLALQTPECFAVRHAQQSRNVGNSNRVTYIEMRSSPPDWYRGYRSGFRRPIRNTAPGLRFFRPAGHGLKRCIAKLTGAIRSY